MSPSPSITRTTLNNILIPYLQKIPPGNVLDVGAKDSPYRQYLSSRRYLRLDISARTKPDIVGDITDFKWPSAYFDTIIATEILEHLPSPQKAVAEIWRVLKPGGTCLLSTRFIFPYHPDPKDYYRYTVDSLSDLFGKFRRHKIIPHGNRLHVLWQILGDSHLGILLRPLTPLVAKINFPDAKFPLGFVVIAKK